MCMPGDNVDMKVELITPIAIEKGLRFAIREGGRTVGSGVVIETEGLIDPLRVIQRLQKAAGRKGLLLFYYRKCKGSAKPAASHFLYSYLAQTQRSKSSERKAASFDA